MGKPGRFISFEGGEGTGKSTQAKRLAAVLEARKIACVVTREPGGSPGAEEIRKMLATDNGFDFTKRIVRPDGAIRHVRCVGIRATTGGTVQNFAQFKE